MTANETHGREGSIKLVRIGEGSIELHMTYVDKHSVIRAFTLGVRMGRRGVNIREMNGHGIRISVDAANAIAIKAER